jgi:hypothetical protein
MLSHGLQRPRALRTPAYHRDPKTTRVAAMRVTRAWPGAKPGDLPVWKAGRYTLAINLETAKAPGLILTARDGRPA